MLDPSSYAQLWLIEVGNVGVEALITRNLGISCTPFQGHGD
jgi:hypothetical protein